MRRERGQASILLLGAMGALIAFALVLASLGQALGSRGRAQRVADLAAVSGARAMRDNYQRLFEPPGAPRRLDVREYLALARAAAIDGARRNGLALAAGDVSFPDGESFAPTRVAVDVRDTARVRITGDRRRSERIPVRAHAEAGLTGAGGTFAATGGDGEYTGPLALRQGKPMRPIEPLGLAPSLPLLRGARLRLPLAVAGRARSEV